MIHKRLEAQDLVKLRLPLNTPPTKPHVPIFITANNLPTKRRVVVLFGESTQDLGILAHRAVGGQDGVNEGSMVSIVQRILDDDTDAGIILANTGENWWWPEGQRALCYRQSLGVRMKSAVHKGRAFDPAANGIPKNGDVKAHVKCVFESVLGNGEFLGREARIDVLAMTDAANEVEKYLDANWGRWESHIGCLAMLGGGENPDAIRDEGFKTFLKEVCIQSLCPPELSKKYADTHSINAESSHVHHWQRARWYSHCQPRRQFQNHPLHLLRLPRARLR